LSIQTALYAGSWVLTNIGILTKIDTHPLMYG
jgi:hypothetical protein